MICVFLNASRIPSSGQVFFRHIDLVIDSKVSKSSNQVPIQQLWFMLRFSSVGEPLQLTKSSCFHPFCTTHEKQRSQNIWKSDFCPLAAVSLGFPVNLCPWIPLAAYYETIYFSISLAVVILSTSATTFTFSGCWWVLQ